MRYSERATVRENTSKANHPALLKHFSILNREITSFISIMELEYSEALKE